jgi:hypothetical protein
VSVYVDGEKREVPPPLPWMRTRPMMGRARLYDGQSLLLIGSGASVTNKSDKIPVLGDLRSFLILITPTLIDPAGNSIHTPDNLPFDPNSIPPQPK